MTPPDPLVAARLATCLAGADPPDAGSSRLAWDAGAEGIGEPWIDLAGVAEADVDRWLALERACEAARGMDARAAAAYLIGRLGFALGTWLVRLHYAGLAIRPAPMAGLRARPRLVAWEHEGEVGSAPVFDFLIGPASVVLARTDDPRHVGDMLTALMHPLIVATHDRSGLATAALWRQLADSLAAAFLEHGKANGLVGRAMADARAAIAAPSPLWNRQVGFVELRLPSDPVAGRPGRCEWFRARGGCCRYHTLEGGEYCSTCVHRSAQSREARLLDLMRDKAAS